MVGMNNSSEEETTNKKYAAYSNHILDLLEISSEENKISIQLVHRWLLFILIKTYIFNVYLIVFLLSFDNISKYLQYINLVYYYNKFFKLQILFYLKILIKKIFMHENQQSIKVKIK